MSQTSVTSVESTDQGQPPLPEREGAYKRRILDGLEHWKLDKETNHSGGLAGEKSEIFDILYNDLQKEFNEISFLFAGWMTCYTSKHKFFGTGPTKSKSEYLCNIALLKSYENDYRMAYLPENPSLFQPRRIYDKNKYNDVGANGSLKDGDHNFIFINSIKEYKEYKPIIMKVIGLSYNMASKYWDKRFKYSTRRGVFYAGEVVVENDISECRSYVDKYFDPSYTYDPSKL